MLVKTLGIVGCGLIGGSLALAAKKYDCFQRIVGRDLDSEALGTALDLGIIDAVWQEGDRVDAACLAVPTQYIAGSLEQVALEVADSVPIFDVGSVKISATAMLESIPANFVPCHPIAGSHKRGPSAADAELFQGNSCVICPATNTSETMIEMVSDWWRRMGASVILMNALTHDDIVSRTSHLPHLLACAAVELVRNQGESANSLAGSGFRDFSRIAAGDDTVWRHIFVDNLTNLRIGFKKFSAQVEAMLELAEEDPDALEDLLRAIAQYRRSMYDE